MNYAFLAQISRTDSAVAAPVVHALAVEAYRHKAQLVKPAVYSAVLVYVTCRLACPHGDAQNFIIVKLHGAGKRGNVAVVCDEKRHVPELGSDVDIHIFDLFVELVLGNFNEQRCRHDFIVDVNACAGNADSVHLGQFVSGGFESRINFVVVIRRVLVYFGKP